MKSRSTDRHSAAQTCADPCPKRPQGSNVSRRRQRSTRRTRSKAAPTSRQRLCLLRRRPSSDRMSGARPGGPCRSVGGQVPGARRVSPASHSEPAGIHHAFFEPRVSPRSRGKCPKDKGGARDAQPRAGRPKRGADRRLLLSAAGGRLQPERSPRGRIQGGGELRTAYPSAAPNSMPAVWRRGPRLLNVASGLAHRSAQHLTPLRGRPLPKGRGDGEGRSQGPCTGTDALGEGQFLRARGPCAAGPSPGKARRQTTTSRWTYRHAPELPKERRSIPTVPFRDERGREQAKRDRRGMLGRTRGRTNSTEDRVLQYSDEGRRECSRSYG